MEQTQHTHTMTLKIILLEKKSHLKRTVAKTERLPDHSYVVAKVFGVVMSASLCSC